MEARSYRRPDLQWKCGLAQHDQRCALGPDYRGRCQSQQCQPQRTLDWWRSYLPTALATATVVIIVCLIAIRQDLEIIAPGPLSTAHAQLIHDPSDPHRCASCHEDASNRSVPSAMNHQLAAAHTQTQRCRACHIRELPQLKRSTPHDLPVDHLESMTTIAKASIKTAVIRPSSTRGFDASRSEDESSDTRKSIQSWLVGLIKHQPMDWHQHSLACSDCHREHQGAKHDLQAISNERCQACHQTQFEAFADGHPEFSDYPATASVRIAFDHARHRDLHFAKSNAKFDCRVCHLNGAEQGRVGQIFRSVAFETACAACHLAPMKASLADGVIVFQLPSIDVQGLATRGSAIRDWPEAASQILDGRLPPLMRWLLMGEQQGLALLEQLPDSGKLSDFDIEDREHRRAIVKLADASRQLLNQLAGDGQLELQKRLLAAQDPPDQALIEQLKQGLPPDLFRQAYREWFDNESHANLAASELKGSATVDVASSGQLKDDKDFQQDSDHRLAGNNQLSASKSPTSLSTTDRLLDDPVSNDDLLAADVLATDQSLLNSNSLSSNIETKRSPWKPLKAIKQLESGGWMIDRQRMAIVYIPTGHADPWLTAMLTLGSQLNDSNSLFRSSDAARDSQSPADQLASSRLAKESAGRCFECHSSVNTQHRRMRVPAKLDSEAAQPNIRFHQHWRADRFDARVRQLTHFDHGPHLLQSSLTDCVACHHLVRNRPVASKAAHRDFQPMSVQDCAACHQSKAAGDHCTQCHHYHTNGINPETR